MTAIMFRIALIAVGLGLAEIGLVTVIANGPLGLLQLALAIVFLVAGSAGFIVPLLGGSSEGPRNG